MKKIIYLVFLLTSMSAFATPVEVNEKVLKAFKETFTEAEQVSWSEVQDKSQADFMVDEIRVRAIYDQNATLIQTIRYYKAKELPCQILAKIKKKYSGKEITGVTELSTENEIDYQIVVRDDINYYILNADAFGNLNLTQKLKRGDL